MKPTPGQLRAARGMLNLSREQAAHAAGLNHSTLGKAERGDPTLTRESLDAIVAAYTARGVVFVGCSGIERRVP